MEQRQEEVHGSPWLEIHVRGSIGREHLEIEGCSVLILDQRDLGQKMRLGQDPVGLLKRLD
jgi:hypothetical protein